MRLRVLETSLLLRNCRTRIPFRFGMNTMTAAPLCVMKVLVEAEDGRRGIGLSSDLLVPKWFEKNPDTPIERDWTDLIGSAQEAGRFVCEDPACASVFDRWWAMYVDRVGAAPAGATDLLVRGHGVSLVERAMMDATCSLAGVGFFAALKSDLFGFRPGVVDPALAGWSIANSIGDGPLPGVGVRHTVGLVDAIRIGDVKERIDDGLPESLEEDIRHYGLTRFKLKLCGDEGEDLERLSNVASVLREEVRESVQVTIDGNEQFDSIERLVGLFRQMMEQEQTRWLLDRLAYVEQPLGRGVTFDADANSAMADLAQIAPCIIDEADFGTDSFPRAVELGYRGVSVKNCKGVFRALANRGRCDLSGGTLIQSGEDLTNLPIIALQQDLATMSTLGLDSVERNGHHYFDGLGHLPSDEQAAALAAHPDLYMPHPRGVQLRIENGQLSTTSIHACAGYGSGVSIVDNEWVPAESWSPASVLG